MKSIDIKIQDHRNLLLSSNWINLQRGRSNFVSQSIWMKYLSEVDINWLIFTGGSRLFAGFFVGSCQIGMTVYSFDSPSKSQVT